MFIENDYLRRFDITKISLSGGKLISKIHKITYK